MSLWMQEATEALGRGEYRRFRQDLLPMAPFPIPACLLREVEYGERHCQEVETDRLFPIRFLWVFEAIEQTNWGLEPGARSIFNPESLYGMWERLTTDHQFRKECEEGGSRFDFAEKAMESSHGWIYIGDSFIDDFLELENGAGVELQFPSGTSGESIPAFVAAKRERSRGIE